MLKNKIVDIDSFINIKEKKLKGKEVVVLSGSFDMFHRGHLEFLEFAKEKGDILVVLLNSDSSIKKYKGIKRPIVEEKDRAYILQGLEVVDYIIIFNELTPEKYFEKILPEVSCHGSDWSKEFIGIDVLRKNNTKIYYFKEKDSSTSSIMDKIKESINFKDNKVLFYDSKEFLEKDLEFVKTRSYLLKKINNFLNINEFISFCGDNNININKSFYIGLIDKNIEFSKKVNLRVIEVSGNDKKLQEIINLRI